MRTTLALPGTLITLALVASCGLEPLRPIDEPLDAPGTNDPPDRPTEEDLPAERDDPCVGVLWGDRTLATYTAPSADYDTTALAVVRDGAQPAHYVAGRFYDEGVGRQAFVIRVCDDGALDTSFGDGGWVTGLALESTESITLAVDPHGRLWVAGGSEWGQHTWIARLDLRGALDATFGEGGIVDWTHADFFVPGEMGLVTDEDDDGGALLVEGNGAGFSAVKLDDDGALDATFGVDGVRLVELPGSISPEGFVWAVARPFDLARDERGYVVGADGEGDVFVVRLTSDGALDASYGVGGVARFDVGFTYDGAASLALDAGRVVIAGVAVEDVLDCTRSIGFVARLDAGGLLDSSFGIGGVVLAERHPCSGWTAVALDGDELWVAGYDQGNSTAGRAAFARLASDGAVLAREVVASWPESNSQGDVFTDVELAADGTVTLVGGVDPSAWGRAAFMRLAATE